MNSAPPQPLALAFVVIDVRSADLSEQRIIFSISSLFAVMSAKLFLVLQRLKGLVHTPATRRRFTGRGLMPGRHFMNGFLPGAHGAPQWSDSPAACLPATSDECFAENTSMDPDHICLSSVCLCCINVSRRRRWRCRGRCLFKYRRLFRGSCYVFSLWFRLFS